MRHLLVPLLVLAGTSATVMAQQSAPAAAAGDDAEAATDHPKEVAWVDEHELGFTYRRFPGGQRIYYFDDDKPGHSNCNDGCASAWPPVPAPAKAKGFGPWKVIVRKDGTRQWALAGRPVYTRFHDAPEKPQGDGLEGKWHLVPHFSQAQIDQYRASNAAGGLRPVAAAPKP